jgi:hypothetical protein
VGERQRERDRDIYKRESMLVCEHKEDQRRIIFFLIGEYSSGNKVGFM